MRDQMLQTSSWSSVAPATSHGLRLHSCLGLKLSHPSFAHFSLKPIYSKISRENQLASNLEMSSAFERGHNPTVQFQARPGLEKLMFEKPIIDQLPTGHGGYQPYKAAGKLQGRKALITGGDSGIVSGVLSKVIPTFLFRFKRWPNFVPDGFNSPIITDSSID